MSLDSDTNACVRMWRAFRWSKSFWPAVALFALLAYNLIFTEHFADIKVTDGHFFGPMIDILRNSCIVMLLATGMTLVIATRGIDLSVGAIMAIAGGMAAMLLSDGHGLFVVISASLAIAAIAGLWNGVLISLLKLQPIVATLCLMVAGRGIARLITGGATKTVSNKAFIELGNGYIFMLPTRLLIVAFVVVAAIVFTRKTVAGLYIEASGANESASRLSGLRPALVIAGVYAFLGLCSGFSGLIYVANIKAVDIMKIGQYVELDAILAVVIGGTSFSGGRANIVGSIIGALIMQTLKATIFLTEVDPKAILVVKAVAVIAVCLLQSPRFRDSTINPVVGLIRRTVFRRRRA